MSDFDRLNSDKAPKLSPETRAAACRYLIRNGLEDLLVVLGLAHDPIAERMNRAEAAAAMHGGISVPTEACTAYGKPEPKGGSCRRTKRCREAGAP